ncbi:transposase [Streptomyces vinaceus]|uniref:transposase n=1 Tax=Streptomyces vinaceus TaxID=1960 RepID=UPI00380DA892
MDHGFAVRRHELSDAEWELVQPLLPRPVFGRPRLDDRTVLNWIVWKFRTGVAWRDVPGRYGSWDTAKSMRCHLGPTRPRNATNSPAASPARFQSL